MIPSKFSSALSAMLSDRFFFALVLGLALVAPTAGHAQVGNDNPTGVSGFFNGNVNSGGSYDPYTGNATRSVTDLVVAGGVGKYPLAFTRTMNTRYTPGVGTLEFGQAGTWRHNYQWTIDSFTFQSNAPDKWYAMPLVYTVNYPDGRRLSFFNSNTDTMMRASPGISDRFQKPAGTQGGDCYLLLPDGGKVWFTMTVDRWGDDFGPVTSTFDFTFNGIIDPHGQATTVGYAANGSLQITEPAGRWLQLFYVTAPWNGDVLLDRVVASDGRSVKYNYGPYQPAGATTYSYLGNVQYLDTNGASYTQAIYWYMPGNVDPNGRPLIFACIDPMYSGPMWAIAYNYAGSAVYGLIHREHYFNPANGQAGAPVTSVSYNGNSRTETRGDGPERTFNYSGGKLVNYTDFKGQTSYISYDGNGYVGSVTDARGHTTTMIREGIIGALSQYKHHDQSYVGFAYWNTNGGPYHLQIRGDERGKNTYFTRDGNFRLTRIDYPDYPNGAHETFAYNHFGQVSSHRMTSGGIENFHYDGRGMMYASDNPDGTTYYFYDALDRLERVQDPRNHNTRFQYNARGQVTRVTHHDEKFIEIGYDNHGNRISVMNERLRTTTYAYDDYNRLVSVTQPGLPPATFNYAQDWANPYAHTTSNPKGIWSPLGKATHFAYDGNWQRVITSVAPGTSDNAATLYDYDAAGNLTWTQDPRGYATTFGYDSRNRRTSTTNALNQTTSWQYDAASNLIRETRPDQSYRRAEYDSMNRVIDTYGFANEHTHFTRDLAGNVHQMIDPKGATYVSYHDAMNRLASQWYPPDATGVSRYEAWYREAGGLVYRHDSPAGQVQIFEYDDRNRMKHSYWWGHVGPEKTIEYDDASRVTSISTNSGETVVRFGYDDADRQIWEEQTVAGSTRRIETGRNADGLRENLLVPAIGWVNLQYTYNQRNQLERINDAYGNHWFKYDYDPNGNMTKRQNVWAGINNATRAGYDELNRPTSWQNTSAGDTWFAESHQRYDNLGRLRGTWRHEQGKGDDFGYDAMGQLTGVHYNADQVWPGNPLNATRSVTYNVDALNRIGSNGVNENGMLTAYVPNALNQYTSVGGQSHGYDENFNLTGRPGFGANYNAENQLTSASNNGNSAQFIYDGLGRCLQRTINGASTFFLYDGWKPIIEYDGAGNLAAWNVYGPGADEILYRWSPAGGETYYHTDERGNVIYLLDGSGQGIEYYTYDAFGQPAIYDWWGHGRSTSAVGNRFMFTGRDYIQELGIYDFRFRHYQPELGRFLQKDPIGFAAGDANLFRYCGGDPVNFVDPFGLQVFTQRWSKLWSKDKDGGAAKSSPTGPAAGSNGLGILGSGGDISGGSGELGNLGITTEIGLATPSPTLNVQPLPPASFGPSGFGQPNIPGVSHSNPLTFSPRVNVSLVVVQWTFSRTYSTVSQTWATQFSMGFGFTGGASITGGVTATNAGSLSALEGWSRQGGVAAGAPYGPGGEVNLVFGNGYEGVDVGFGPQIGLPISPQFFFNNTLPSVVYGTPSPTPGR